MLFDGITSVIFEKNCEIKYIFIQDVKMPKFGFGYTS